MWCHNDQCLQLLVQLKADVHRVDKKRKNALYWAVSGYKYALCHVPCLLSLSSQSENMYLLTHSLSPVLVLVVVMGSMELKTSRSHAHSLILSHCDSLSL